MTTLKEVIGALSTLKKAQGTGEYDTIRLLERDAMIKIALFMGGDDAIPNEFRGAMAEAGIIWSHIGYTEKSDGSEMKYSVGFRTKDGRRIVVHCPGGEIEQAVFTASPELFAEMI